MQTDPDDKHIDNHNISDQSQQDRETDLNNSRQDKLESSTQGKPE